jgi:sulfhydrogenase subunit delta
MMPNTSAVAAYWSAAGMTRSDIVRVFRGFNASAEAFRREGDLHDT